MQITEILSNIEKHEDTGSSQSIGTIKTLFNDHEMFVVRKSNTNAARAAVLLKKDGQRFTIICSEAMTPAVRAGKITREMIVGLPIFYNEGQNSLYLGTPSSGWVAVENVEVEDFDMSDVAF